MVNPNNAIFIINNTGDTLLFLLQIQPSVDHALVLYLFILLLEFKIRLGLCQIIKLKPPLILKFPTTFKFFLKKKIPSNTNYYRLQALKMSQIAEVDNCK